MTGKHALHVPVASHHGSQRISIVELDAVKERHSDVERRMVQADEGRYVLPCREHAIEPVDLRLIEVARHAARLGRVQDDDAHFWVIDRVVGGLAAAEVSGPAEDVDHGLRIIVVSGGKMDG